MEILARQSVIVLSSLYSRALGFVVKVVYKRQFPRFLPQFYKLVQNNGLITKMVIVE